MRENIFTVENLVEGDTLLYVDCPVLVRTIKSISSRSIMFTDGSSMSAFTLNKQLFNKKFEVTRNGAVIYPF